MTGVTTRPELGDLCHFKNTAVPMAVVTDLKGKIIFSNDISSAGNATHQWAVSGVRVMDTRFWAASTGYVVLVAPDVEADLPDFPLDQADIEKELCIWLGYLDYVRPATQQDLGTRLLRVFVGVIDVVQATSTANGGCTIALQLRDRMKWLMDTKVTYNPAVDQQEGNLPLRSNLILEVAQRGVGQVDSKDGCAICGKSILADEKFLYDLGDKGKEGDVGETPPADVWYTNNGPLAASTRTTNLEVAENPYLRIFTTRAPINLQQGPNFLISDQIPIDTLKFLSTQEIYPTEVFQDARDGNLYYCPRANDISGLSDPKRYFRTYYFKTYPDSLLVEGGNAAPPDFNQMLIGFREERSSLGLKTNFWVSKNAPMAQGGTQDDWTVHLRTRPAALANTKYACKFARVYDDTITTAEEAAVVALNAARILGKEVKAGTAVLLGDPSLSPGECLQLIGSPLQKGKGITNALSDRAQFLQFNRAYNENLKVYAEKSLKDAGAGAAAIEGASVSLPIYDGSTANVTIQGKDQANQDTLICKAGSEIVGPATANADSDPQSTLRIEAILHKYNVGNKGFQSEISLCSPF